MKGHRTDKPGTPWLLRYLQLALGLAGKKGREVQQYKTIEALMKAQAKRAATDTSRRFIEARPDTPWVFRGVERFFLGFTRPQRMANKRRSMKPISPTYLALAAGAFFAIGGELFFGIAVAVYILCCHFHRYFNGRTRTLSICLQLVVGLALVWIPWFAIDHTGSGPPSTLSSHFLFYSYYIPIALSAPFVVMLCNEFLFDDVQSQKYMARFFRFVVPSIVVLGDIVVVAGVAWILSEEPEAWPLVIGVPAIMLGFLLVQPIAQRIGYRLEPLFCVLRRSFVVAIVCCCLVGTVWSISNWTFEWFPFDVLLLLYCIWRLGREFVDRYPDAYESIFTGNSPKR